MKTTTKEIKILSMLVILTLVFLCSFSVVYSYFTSVANAKTQLDFYNLDLNMYYKLSETSTGTAVENQIQLFPSGLLTRGNAVKLKTDPESNVEIYDIGVSSSSGSCAAYVRFYLQVYMVKEIAGNVYYIDSLGNYVNDEGTYVDSLGNVIPIENVTKGEIVDYAEHFSMGMLLGGNMYSEKITRQVNVVNEKNYVSYFLNAQLQVEEDLQVNAIQLLSTAPSEMLDSDLVIFLTMEGVQATNGAYKVVFDDNYGYYNWEN